jgi:aspartyl/asparaginyl beta-hydroxylase (cupin superfamily)
LTYPGLTSRPWHERDAPFAAQWIEHLEAATPLIASEYDNIRKLSLPSDYEAEASDHADALHKGPDEWHWASLIDRGQPRPAMQNRCPRTTAVLNSIPGLCVGDNPFAFAFFSTLRPHCRIAPHTAPANIRLRVHLPLRVPKEAESCGLRVGDETRRWEVGKALLFDDSFEHEAWNDSDEERVVLLFDLWHPDLVPKEIDAIQAMFQEVLTRRDARHGESDGGPSTSS